MDKLKNGGVLAVQIPMNNCEPLFRLIDEVVSDTKWNFNEVIKRTNNTLTPLEYYNILYGCSASFEIWETKYYHKLPDHKELIEFVKGSRLCPYLDSLSADMARKFEEEIIERSKVLYSVMTDGNVVLGFQRFFFTAKNKNIYVIILDFNKF